MFTYIHAYIHTHTYTDSQHKTEEHSRLLLHHSLEELHHAAGHLVAPFELLTATEEVAVPLSEGGILLHQ